MIRHQYVGGTFCCSCLSRWLGTSMLEEPSAVPVLGVHNLDIYCSKNLISYRAVRVTLLFCEPCNRTPPASMKPLEQSFRKWWSCIWSDSHPSVEPGVCSQDPASYPEPRESSQHLHIFKIHANVILSPTAISSMCFFLLRFPSKTCLMFLVSQAYHMSHSFHLPWFDLPFIWQGVQLTVLIIVFSVPQHSVG